MFKMRFSSCGGTGERCARVTISLVRCDLSNSAGQERPLAGLSLRNPEALRHHTPSLDAAVASSPAECKYVPMI